MRRSARGWREIMAEVRAGEFAKALRSEEEADYPQLKQARADSRETLLDVTYPQIVGRAGLGLSRSALCVIAVALADAGALEIGALQLAVGLGGIAVGGVGEFLLFGRPLREICPIIAVS